MFPRSSGNGLGIALPSVTPIHPVKLLTYHVGCNVNIALEAGPTLVPRYFHHELRPQTLLQRQRGERAPAHVARQPLPFG